jgi:hypothetical protein
MITGLALFSSKISVSEIILDGQ